MPLPWSRKSSAIAVSFGGQTDVGRVRERNEDAIGHLVLGDGPEAEHLFVVADGMGGHRDGQRASALAVDTLREQFGSANGDVGERLRSAFRLANERVHAGAVASGAVRGMGTTCTALALNGAAAYVAHVGDSRAYRIGAEGIRQVTEDHTLVQALTRDGVLTPAEAADHPQRHALMRAIGIEAEVEVDVRALPAVQRGEAFVLCSDGLAEVAPAEIRDIVRAHPPQEAADALVTLANDRGGTDNVTVLVVRLG